MSMNAKVDRAREAVHEIVEVVRTYVEKLHGEVAEGALLSRTLARDARLAHEEVSCAHGCCLPLPEGRLLRRTGGSAGGTVGHAADALERCAFFAALPSCSPQLSRLSKSLGKGEVSEGDVDKRVSGSCACRGPLRFGEIRPPTTTCLATRCARRWSSPTRPCLE
jgi:hypothetical protein